mgnify:FL=1
MIDYDLLDTEFDPMPTTGKMARSQNPVGSLTDNVRKVKPNRDGSHKRMHLYEQDGY